MKYNEAIRDEWQFLTQDKELVMAKVAMGVMSPAEAETRAGDMGYGPLEYEPPNSLFDPMEHHSWTLPMALVWLISQEIKDVRIFNPNYVEVKRKWSQTELGWKLSSYPADSLLLVASFAWLRENGIDKDFPEDHSSPELTHMRAQNALLRALESGKVKATGISGGGREEIPTCAWQDYEFETDCSVVSRENGAVAYRNPAFLRDDVMKLGMTNSKSIPEATLGRVPKFLWEGFLATTPSRQCRNFSDRRDRRAEMTLWYSAATGAKAPNWADKTIERYVEELEILIPELRLKKGQS